MIPWTVPTRFLCPWNSPGKNTGVGSLFPSPGDLPDPGIKPGSPALQADTLPSEPPRKPIQMEIQYSTYNCNLLLNTYVSLNSLWYSLWERWFIKQHIICKLQHCLHRFYKLEALLQWNNYYQYWPFTKSKLCWKSLHNLTFYL